MVSLPGMGWFKSWNGPPLEPFAAIEPMCLNDAGFAKPPFGLVAFVHVAAVPAKPRPERKMRTATTLAELVPEPGVIATLTASFTRTPVTAVEKPSGPSFE